MIPSQQAPIGAHIDALPHVLHSSRHAFSTLPSNHMPPGYILAPPGLPRAPHGHTLVPPGLTCAPQGHTLAPQGHTLAPQGHTLMPMGNMPAPLGPAFAPSGTTLAPCGTPPMPLGNPLPQGTLTPVHHRQRATSVPLGNSYLPQGTVFPTASHPGFHSVENPGCPQPPMYPPNIPQGPPFNLTATGISHQPGYTPHTGIQPWAYHGASSSMHPSLWNTGAYSPCDYAAVSTYGPISMVPAATATATVAMAALNTPTHSSDTRSDSNAETDSSTESNSASQSVTDEDDSADDTE